MMKRNQLGQLTTITGLWVLAGLLTALYEYFFLANYPGVVETLPMEEFSLKKMPVDVYMVLMEIGLPPQ